ncbi:MAG: hypothetical protein AB1782_12030 [Cyanobacteriota bacterium]
MSTITNIICTFVLIIVVLIPIGWVIDEASSYQDLDETNSESYVEASFESM